VVATQPRMPCYKLGVKFGRMNIVRRFLASGRPGIYFRVLEEGEVGPGDSIQYISKDKNNVTIKDIARLYVKDATCHENQSIALRMETSFSPLL
jgi:MOSC domain-containing protein YiiM